MECKRALEDAGGKFDRAVDILKEKGFAKAAKKAARETREGLVHCYLHSGGRIAAMLELNCETDFVARTPEFQELAHNLAMQVAAMSPAYVSQEEMAPEDNRPPEEVCLLRQPFIKDPTRQVGELLQEMVAKVGENVRVRRFARFALGE
ncbi:MAG: elongation factor Ts [Chloroflexi bacterium]|nr:elongation factor Ts [Chloroflexota bacterium]